MLSRRAFLATSTAAAFSPRLTFAEAPSVSKSVAAAHDEIWRRFMGRHDVMLDYVDADGSAPIPTPQECHDNKPNALAWWTPIENGAFFNGLYLAAMCDRYRLRKDDKDASAKARRLANGLYFLASVGSTQGFIARGVATDGKAHYPLGSNDQTFPWFYGLWRYLKTDIPDGRERGKLTDKITEVATALERSGWRMPADGQPFTFRGTFASHTWECASRLLFVCQAMFDLTADEHWSQLYKRLLNEPSPADPQVTRRSICEAGMVPHEKRPQSWTESCAVAALRGLWELESDPELSQAYEAGLKRSAAVAATSLPLYQKFNPDDASAFEPDWRKLVDVWKPQASEQEAVDVALAENGKLVRLSPRRTQEFLHVREPLFAAWIVTQCPDESAVTPHRVAIEAMLGHYPYGRLYYSQFFAAELAAYRLGIG